MVYFYRINLLVRTAYDWDPSLGFIQDYPEGIGINSYKLCRGFEISADEYPAHAKMFLSGDSGTVLGDVIGNSCNILIVSSRIKSAFECVNKSPVQYLPVSIFDQQKKLLSADYFIVNPLGSYDILDTQKSSIIFLNNKVVSVETYVSDSLKALNAPDLFRIKENLEAYVISQRMVDYLRKTIIPKPTNFKMFKF